MSKITPTSLRLPDEIDQKLRLESERTGIPMTGLILFAIQSWLEYENMVYTLKLPNKQCIEITAIKGVVDTRKTESQTA